MGLAGKLSSFHSVPDNQLVNFNKTWLECSVDSTLQILFFDQ